MEAIPLFDAPVFTIPHKTYKTTNCKLLGIDVDAFDLNGWIKMIGNHVIKRKRTIILSQNLHSVYMSHRHKCFKDLQHISIKRIDGMSLVLFAKLLGYPLKRDYRVTWVDFIRPLMKEAAENSWKVFYLGNDETTVSKGISALRKDYEDLEIEYANGFFNTEKNSYENKNILKRINNYSPDILIVGMGMPRQEKWILENHKKLNSTVIMTSGAAIEYIAGKVSIPPRWMGSIGFEWLYRLVENPKRFWFRYIIEPWFVLWLFSKDFANRHILKKEL